MTPFGHLGGSLLAAEVIEKVVLKSPVTLASLVISSLIGLLPDLDGFLIYFLGKWKPGRQMLKHHGFPTHTPLFYLLLSLFVWLILGLNTALLFAVLTLLHLLLDSWGTDDGIMWGWPFNKKQISLFPVDLHEGGVFGLQYYLRYLHCARVAVPEGLLLVGGILVLISAAGLF
jgi:hypothetical protein